MVWMPHKRMSVLRKGIELTDRQKQVVAMLADNNKITNSSIAERLGKPQGDCGYTHPWRPNKDRIAK